MKFMNKIRSLSRNAKLAIVAGSLSAVIAAPLLVNAGFFPSRPTFDYNKGSANSNCADPNDPGAQNGRCGSMTGPVFNSFVNTPSYGDEREFLDARLKENTASGSYADPLTNATSGASKEVVLRMYIHNNANQTTNDNGSGVARDTTVRFALPAVEGNALRTVGYISASNSTPSQVVDTVDFTSDKNFTVSYKAGSAILRNNGPFANGVALPDSVVSSGTKIGWDALNGNFPGCFQYDAQVQITVVITPKEVPNMGLTKQVRKTKSGQTGNWSSEVASKPGEKVDWLLNTKNTGKAPLTDVVTRDLLPPHTELVSGSVKFTNARGSQTLNDGPLFGGGYNAGLYNPSENSLITFTTVLKGDFDECQTRIRNVAFAKSKEYPHEIKDDADVVITKEDCKPPVNPIYSCDLLQSKIVSGRKVKFTASASASGGATIKRYVYNFGDGSEEFKTDQNVVEHTYAKDGQYAARVKVEVEVNGQQKIAESDKCATSLTFTTPPTTPPTTPGKSGTTTPTTLPSTGPADVAAIFVAVSTASGVGYYVFSRKHYV